MRRRILAIAVLVSCFAVNARADEIAADGSEAGATVNEAPARQTIAVEFDTKSEEHQQLQQKFERSNPAIVIPTPPEIAAAVKAWTGIDDRGTRIIVRFIHNTREPKYVAMSSGDGYSISGSIKVAGKTLMERETHVHYEETLTASDEDSFDILGIYEFENAVSERRCTVTCRIEGAKTATGNPFSSTVQSTGTATWTGPIVDASGGRIPAGLHCPNRLAAE